MGYGHGDGDPARPLRSGLVWSLLLFTVDDGALRD